MKFFKNSMNSVLQSMKFFFEGSIIFIKKKTNQNVGKVFAF